VYDGHAVVRVLKECGITHAVWIPDSAIGAWESALASDPDFSLIRVCREGEAMALAGGLLLAGKQPVVLIQCTGLFEAGDSLRNIVHDLKLPLFLIIGLRGYYAHQRGATNDTCPIFAEPVLNAWKIPYLMLDPNRDPLDRLGTAYRTARAERRAGAVLLAE
jgi:sulfopyruvate decarboxylase subunit alpha